MQERPQTLARATEGDANSFATLLEPLLDPAYRLAAVMLDDRSAAEDAVQEASIKAWRKLRQLRGEVGSLRSWFLSIVANECRMARRQRWWSVVRLPDIRTAAEAGAMSDEPATDLKAALLVLHFYLDLPLEEVARTLGVTTAAAKSRIYRAAKKLKSDLTLEEVF